MTHTVYIVQYYHTDKDPERQPIRENDFGYWQDSNESYSSLEEAEEEFNESETHSGNEVFRIVERTTTIQIETRERTLKKHLPFLPAQ